jgi:hypothetical protein
MSDRPHRLVSGSAAALAVCALLCAVPAFAQGGVGAGSGSGGQGTTIVTSSGVPSAPTVLPDGTGVISGTITDVSTGAPIVGAVVSLSVASRASIGRDVREITDGRGRFVFTKLPAHDDYQVSAAMPGYFNGSYAQTSQRPNTPRIAITDGQWFPNANIALSKGGSIAGTVLDERGEPVVGIFVHVFAQVLVSGVHQLASGPSATTDDRGMYRIANLGAGDYIVSVPSVAATVPSSVGTVTGTAIPFATFDPDSLSRLAIGKYPIPPPPQDGRRFTYPATYATDAPTPARATPIRLALGEARTNVDLRLTPAAAGTIRGRVDGVPEGVPALTLRLLPTGIEGLGIGSEAGTAMVAADGSFTFLNVAPGTYAIDVRKASMEFSYSGGGSDFNPRLPLPPGANSFSISSNTVESGPAGVQATTTSISRGDESDLWGHASVTVGGGDIASVVVPLHHGSKLAGHATRESKDPTKLGSQPLLGVRAEPADGSPSTGLVPSARLLDDPMDFELTGVTPGRYVLRFPRQVAGWAVKSITIGGEDFTYRPIEVSDGRDVTNIAVVLTDQAPTLNGVVRNSDPAIKETSAIVFPVEPDQWANYGLTPVRVKTATANPQGNFHLSTLPEGEYFVVAVPTADVDAWQDPEFLKLAARTAMRVSLKWGQSATADAPLVRVR